MMRRTSLLAGTLTAGIAVLALAGCVKKQPTEVSPTYTPEGAFSTKARLVVYPDVPTSLSTFIDKNPVGEIGPEDSLVSVEQVRKAPAGTIHMMLFDGTQASAFEMLRREPGGGYFSFNDFLINPSRKWIDGQREVYVTRDARPSSFSPATYLMRGIVGGEITPESPLTNVAMVSPTPIQTITYTGISAPNDSLFTISWVAVPNAIGYWVQVYQFLEAQRDDQVISGVPAPAYVERERDYFFGFVPAPNVSYKLGSTPADVDIFTRRTLLRGQTYLVRVAAVDASGALIALTLGDFGVIPGEGLEYTLYPLGANVINVRSDPAQQATMRPVGDRHLPRVDGWVGDVPVVRAR